MRLTDTQLIILGNATKRDRAGGADRSSQARILARTNERVARQAIHIRLSDIWCLTMDRTPDKLELPANAAGSPTPGTQARHEAIGEQIAELASLDLGALRLRWRNETGRRAPPRLPKFLLLRMLAYRMQAAAFGDLDQATEQALKRISRQRKRSKPESSGRKSGKRRRTLQPGTVLVREWNGKLRRVTVIVGGFSWDGKTYGSLSMVAKAITGTQWSGPRFFGLLQDKPPDEDLRPPACAGGSP